MAEVGAMVVRFNPTFDHVDLGTNRFATKSSSVTSGRIVADGG
jgi:hypothetical protein